MITSGLVALFIGTGLIGGAIDNGGSMLVPVLVFVAGLILVWKGMLDEERDKKRAKRNRNRRDYYDFGEYASKSRRRA